MKAEKKPRVYGARVQKSALPARTGVLENGYETILSPIISQITRRPEVVKQTDQIVSNSENRELQMYYAGAEYGHMRGHDEGFSKGFVCGVIGFMLLFSFSKK